MKTGILDALGDVEPTLAFGYVKAICKHTPRLKRSIDTDWLYDTLVIERKKQYADRKNGLVTVKENGIDYTESKRYREAQRHYCRFSKAMETQQIVADLT